MLFNYSTFIYIGFFITLLSMLGFGLNFIDDFYDYFSFLWGSRILIIIEIFVGFWQLYSFYKRQFSQIEWGLQRVEHSKVFILEQLWLISVSIIIGIFLGLYVVLVNFSPVYKLIVDVHKNGDRLICGRVMRETKKTFIIKSDNVYFKVYKSKDLLLATRDLYANKQYKLCINGIYRNSDDYSIKNLVLFSGKFDKIVEAKTNMFDIFPNVKLQMVKNLSATMGQSNASFFVSMLFGGSTLNQDLVDKMKDIGIIHIVAVSGYNIVLFFQLANIFLDRLKSHRWILEGFLLVIFYLFIGSSPPVDRAFVSFIVVRLLNSLGLYSSKFDRFLFSNFILLILRPIYIFSVSYYLTLTATFVVIFVLPIFDNRLNILNYILQSFLKKKFKNKRTRRVVEHVIKAINKFILEYVLGSVLVFVFLSPIIWIFFRSFNLKSIFYNILILPIIDILVPIGYLVIWLSYFKFGSYIVAFIVGPFLGLISVIAGLE